MIVLEAYPTELTDAEPIITFQCGDRAECHADDHIPCT